MDNGAKKGGTPSAWDILEKSPRLENLWQLHFSDEGGSAHDVAAEFIANPQGTTDAGNDLELTACRAASSKFSTRGPSKPNHIGPNSRPRLSQS